MLYFDHYGRETAISNRFRQLFVTVLLALEAVALFPFTLLGLFCWGLWRLLAQSGRRLSFR